MSDTTAIRKRNLAQVIAQQSAQGWRVESQSDYQAVLVKGKPTNHLLHLVLTFLTFGLWLFVWPVVVLINREQRKVLTVDDYGNVTGA